jgi:hypothetical protein
MPEKDADVQKIMELIQIMKENDLGRSIFSMVTTGFRFSEPSRPSRCGGAHPDGCSPP